MPAGHRVYATVLQAPSKVRAPAIQVGFAGRQAHAVLPIGTNRKVHVRRALIFVHHEHVLVSLEQLARSLGGSLDALSAGDMLVPDRGYPAAWCLFALLDQRNIGFCAGLDSCGCASSQVKQFMRSGAPEQIIEQL